MATSWAITSLQTATEGPLDKTSATSCEAACSPRSSSLTVTQLYRQGSTRAETSSAGFSTRLEHTDFCYAGEFTLRVTSLARRLSREPGRSMTTGKSQDDTWGQATANTICLFSAMAVSPRF